MATRIIFFPFCALIGVNYVQFCYQLIVSLYARPISQCGKQTYMRRRMEWSRTECFFVCYVFSDVMWPIITNIFVQNSMFFSFSQHGIIICDMCMLLYSRRPGYVSDVLKDEMQCVHAGMWRRKQIKLSFVNYKDVFLAPYHYIPHADLAKIEI